MEISLGFSTVLEFRISTVLTVGLLFRSRPIDALMKMCSFEGARWLGRSLGLESREVLIFRNGGDRVIDRGDFNGSWRMRDEMLG